MIVYDAIGGALKQLLLGTGVHRESRPDVFVQQLMPSTLLNNSSGEEIS